jgi:glutaredoxin
MQKKNKIIIGTIAVVFIMIGLFLYSITRKSSTAVPVSDIIFFYGRECPHCKEAERFIQDNKIDQKVKFDSVEVWHNQNNANLLVQKARECGMADLQISVPFVWNQGKCYVGTPDVEAFLKGRAGI